MQIRCAEKAYAASCCSCGSAELPGDTSNASNALQLADQRMYADKDSRRPTTGGEVEAVLLRILNQRAPLMAKLGTGVLRLDTASGAERFVVTGGYAQMKDDVLTVLTSHAIPAAQVNAQMIAAEEAKLKAIEGVDLPALEKRQSLQAHIQALKSVLS